MRRPTPFDDTAADDDDVELTASDESAFTDEADDYQDDDDTDAKTSSIDTPDEFQPEVEWAEATEADSDAAEPPSRTLSARTEVEGLNEVRDAGFGRRRRGRLHQLPVPQAQRRDLPSLATLTASEVRRRPAPSPGVRTTRSETDSGDANRALHGATIPLLWRRLTAEQSVCRARSSP